MSGRPSTSTRSEPGSTAAAPTVPVRRALAWSQLYRLLALAFRYPDAARVGALAQLAGALQLEALGQSARGLRPTLAELASAARGTTPEGLQDQYVATFGHVTLPDCPLYESACGIGDPFQQPQTLADIAGFYRAFGLEMAKDAAERVDHLAVELEFMHYLAYREAYALEHHGQDQARLLRDAQRRFLQDHLGRWGPVIARTVAARVGGVLGAAARLLERALAAAARRWRSSPPPVAATAHTKEADERTSRDYS